MPEIRVKDEQGRIHVFPDGSTPEMIAQAMGVKPPAASAPAAPEKPGFMSTLGSDLYGMVKGIPSIVANATPIGDLYQNIAHYGEREKDMAQHAAEQKAEGYSLPYRILSPGAENLGVNVRGMEQSANEGDPGGVLGHAAAVPTAIAATAGLGKAASLPIPEGLSKAATAPVRIAARSAESLGDIPGVGTGLKAARKVYYANTPADQIPKFQMPGRDFGLAPKAPKLPSSEGLPEVEAARPEAHAQLQSRIATERGLRDQEPFPRQSEGLPEVEEAQPVATEHLRKAIATPHEPQALPAIKPAKVEAQLNESLGGKPLQRNVPLRQQLPNAPTPVPAPKESSVIGSHSYDPAARELTVKTKNGGEYIHGDVSPEQAKAFASAESKGKAWNDIRNNSTLVAKVVNGKRVSIKPTAARIATPNDLAP